MVLVMQRLVGMYSSYLYIVGRHGTACGIYDVNYVDATFCTNIYRTMTSSKHFAIINSAAW
jgi:hypothetical protein